MNNYQDRLLAPSFPGTKVHFLSCCLGVVELRGRQAGHEDLPGFIQAHRGQAIFIRLYATSMRKLVLIVTTSTTPKHQNEDEDGDGDAGLCHVAVQVDDVTPL